MNFCKKVFSVLLALLTMMSLLCVGVAAQSATPDTQIIEVVAGETVELPFYVDAYGFDGTISVGNRNLFSSLSVDKTVGGGTADPDAGRFMIFGSSKAVIGFTLKGQIAADAKVGSRCEVKITYLRTDNALGTEYEEGLTKKVIVEVIKKTTTTTTTTKKPTTTTKKATTTTKKPTTAPTKKPVANLDLTELNKQIGIAETLIKTDYTYDSWARLEEALKAAKNARYADTQAEVNAAAAALRDAINGLVKVDGTALRELLAVVREFLNDNDLASIWGDLLAAIEEAEAALLSGDQEAINTAYDNLKKAFEAFKERIAALGEDKIVIQEVEVEAACDTECHVWSRHLLWLILLIISAVLNLGFIVLIVIYFVKRKKNAADNTPLIDYNINDD